MCHLYGLVVAMEINYVSKVVAHVSFLIFGWIYVLVLRTFGGLFSIVRFRTLDTLNSDYCLV